MRLMVKADDAQLAPLANMLAAAGDKAQHAMRRAVNRAGDQAKTQVIRALTLQTGLKRKVIVKALKVTRANYGSLTYTMTTRGGDISLRYFGAKEKGNGVVAKPRGQTTFYAGTFIRSGKSPNRYAVKKLNAHVYENVEGGKWGGKIEKVKSGVYIPQEMVRGETASVFQRVARDALEKRIRHELSQLLG